MPLASTYHPSFHAFQKVTSQYQRSSTVTWENLLMNPCRVMDSAQQLQLETHCLVSRAVCASSCSICSAQPCDSLRAMLKLQLVVLSLGRNDGEGSLSKPNTSQNRKIQSQMRAAAARDTLHQKGYFAPQTSLCLEKD